MDIQNKIICFYLYVHMLVAGLLSKYYHSVTGDTRLETMYQEVAEMEKKELASIKFSQYEDRFQVLIILAIGLLCVELLTSERVRQKKEWHGRFES